MNERKKWMKDFHYTEQTEIRCCLNCAHSWFGRNANLYCEMLPINKVTGEFASVSSLGICKKYKWMEE